MNIFKRKKDYEYQEFDSAENNEIDVCEEDDYYEECPVCGERMHPADYGNWWACDNCSTEAETDEYGNLCFEDPDCIASDDADGEESISIYDAALIWASHGKDEDYTFGFSEEELEDAF